MRIYIIIFHKLSRLVLAGLSEMSNWQKFLLVSLVVLMLMYKQAFAQDYSGTYTIPTSKGVITLKLTQHQSGVSGQLIGDDGIPFQIEGKLEDGEVIGYLLKPNSSGDQFELVAMFEAFLEGQQLYFTLVPMDAQGNALHDSATESVFQKQSDGSVPSGGIESSPDRSVLPIPQQNQADNQQMVAPPAENYSAQLVAGQQYTPGTRVQVPSAGVSFVLPAEWMGGMPVGKSAFILGSNTRGGMGIIFPYGHYVPQQVLQGLNGPQDFGQGQILQPSGPPRQEGNRIWIEYTGYSQLGSAVGYALILPGSFNNAVVIFFGGLAQDGPYFQQLVRSVAASVQFSAPRADAETQQWRQLLAGMMLVKMSSYYSGDFDGSYVGGGSKEALHLCSDGRFVYFSSSSVAGDAGDVSGYSGGSGSQTGRWELQTLGGQVQLILHYDNGQQSQHVISFDGQKTLLDGQRVYRVKSDQCY